MRNESLDWLRGQYAKAAAGVEPVEKPEPDHVDDSVVGFCRLCDCMKKMPRGGFVCFDCDNELERER